MTWLNVYSIRFFSSSFSLFKHSVVWRNLFTVANGDRNELQSVPVDCCPFGATAAGFMNHLATLGRFVFYLFIYFSTVVYKWDITVEIDTQSSRTENKNSNCRTCRNMSKLCIYSYCRTAKCNTLTLQVTCRCQADRPTLFLTSVRPRRFSFFSRDKQRSSQRAAHLDFGSWAGKDDVYTEQAQEALQHMWGAAKVNKRKKNKHLKTPSTPTSHRPTLRRQCNGKGEKANGWLWLKLRLR